MLSSVIPRIFMSPCIDIFQTDLSVNLSKQPYSARCEIAPRRVRQVVTLYTGAFG